LGDILISVEDTSCFRAEKKTASHSNYLMEGYPSLFPLSMSGMVLKDSSSWVLSFNLAQRRVTLQTGVSHEFLKAIQGHTGIKGIRVIGVPKAMQGILFRQTCLTAERKQSKGARE
jgi:hypothetical protein